MNNFRISFERPLFLLLLLPAFLLILLPFLRFPKNRRRSVKRIAPVVLHLLISLLLVLVIAGVSVVTKSSKQTVMILMDISGSMDQVSDEVEEKTQELLTDLPKDAQVGVLAFSENETLLIDPKSNQRTLSSVPAGGTGSDIASVLEEASSFFSDDYAARMILLSDGEETNSKAESMASYLATNGVEVDVMYFDTAAGSKEMQINQVSTVSSCYLGDQIELTVEVESNYEEEIVLTLLDNGEMIQETPVEVQKGTNLYTLSTIAKTSGIRAYSVELTNMADAGITVSTIGLGYTSSTLENMATIGSGRYYYVSSTKDLPDIMLSETEQVVVNAIIENETSVQIAKNEEVLEGVTDEMIPTLSGYIGLTEKQDATVLLKTEDDRPILTSWQYGHGTVTVFSGDLTGSWSENWYNSSVGQYLISQICTGFVDLEDAESSMMAEVKVEGTNVSFTVTTAEKEEGDSVLATVMTSAGETNLELLSNGKGTYSATINVAESGIHSLVFLQKNAADENVDYYMTSFSINYSSEYDEFRDDGETVLMHLAELTGGIVSQDVKTLATKKPNEIYISQNPLALLSILILVMLIVDIAIRKLRLKDIKRVLGIH